MGSHVAGEIGKTSDGLRPSCLDPRISALAPSSEGGGHGTSSLRPKPLTSSVAALAITIAGATTIVAAGPLLPPPRRTPRHRRSLARGTTCSSAPWPGACGSVSYEVRLLLPGGASRAKPRTTSPTRLGEGGCCRGASDRDPASLDQLLEPGLHVPAERQRDASTSDAARTSGSAPDSRAVSTACSAIVVAVS
jgi:hypothetical protein